MQIMEFIYTLLPYIGAIIVSIAGGFFLNKATRKQQNAAAEDAEWKVWKDQLETITRLNKDLNAQAADRQDKWERLTALHENSVKDSADKAILIAQQKVVIATVSADRDEQKAKALKYKTDNAELMKALSEVPSLKKKIAGLLKRVEQLEEQLVEETCTDSPCAKRKNRDGK